MTDTAKTDTRDWDDLRPDARLVYYEGDDLEGFAAEMLTEFGIDVKKTMSHSFFIPAGLHRAIYYSGRWPLGS